MNEIALNAVVCDFSVDYGVTCVKNVLNIHDCLRKNKI